MNLLKITQKFKTQDEALDYLIQARWPNGVRCLACQSAKVYNIATHGKTKKVARLFECADCGLHFSATTGTLFHDSHLPLQKWFMAMALMCEAKKGISANQVARHIGVQYKTAWHLCHRIRRAMEEKTIRPLSPLRPPSPLHHQLPARPTRISPSRSRRSLKQLSAGQQLNTR
jgi:transposase-like protein